MSNRTNWTHLRRLVGRIESSGTRIGVAAVGPTGDQVVHRGEERFGAASTVKIPLMVELYRRIDAGDMSLADKIPVATADHAPGSGVLLHMHDGVVVTLEDMIYLMISISDNTATNMLIELAGMDRVNDTMRSLSMTKSTLGRVMMGRSAQGDEQENWATPEDYVRVIEAILGGTAASENSCRQMTDMLRKQQNRRRIARFIPDDDGIDWGTKTGAVKNVSNDVGFVKTTKGTLILSIFTEGFAEDVRAEEAIGKIARAAMRATNVLSPIGD